MPQTRQDQLMVVVRLTSFGSRDEGKKYFIEKEVRRRQAGAHWKYDIPWEESCCAVIERCVRLCLSENNKYLCHIDYIQSQQMRRMIMSVSDCWPVSGFLASILIYFVPIMKFLASSICIKQYYGDVHPDRLNRYFAISLFPQTKFLA
jgi:hypothetical protein